MNTTERIYAEVKRFPEAAANEVLDFILFFARTARHGANGKERPCVRMGCTLSEHKELAF